MLFIFAPGIYFTYHMATDPKWQFVFNGIFTCIWIVAMAYTWNMPIWAHDSGGRLIMEVSLWANFITHYGAMGANIAAILANGDHL